MAERLPPGAYDTDNMRPAYVPNGLEPNGIHFADANGEHHSRSNSINGSSLASPSRIDSATIKGTHGHIQILRGTNETNSYPPSMGLLTSNGKDDHPDVRLPNGNGGIQASSDSAFEAVSGRESESFQDRDGMKSRNSALTANSNQVEAEWIEQYEPGVYITLVALQDGTRDLKRVRFRYLTKAY